MVVDLDVGAGEVCRRQQYPDSAYQADRGAGHLHAAKDVTLRVVLDLDSTVGDEFRDRLLPAVGPGVAAEQERHQTIRYNHVQRSVRVYHVPHGGLFASSESGGRRHI